jgi:hypothetical protein
MSRLALTPTNVPASATDISIPTLRAGDLYYNTSDGLKVYTGSVWTVVQGGSGTLTDVDGGAFDSIAPYQGGSTPSIASTQTVNGGTP